MADSSTKEREQRFWQRLPIPTTLTLCLLAFGIGVAALLGWKALLALIFGILVLCILDHTRALRDGEIKAERLCPRHATYGIEHDIEILLKNTSPSNKRIQLRDQTPDGWKPAPVLKTLISGGSSLSLNYRMIPPKRGKYLFGDIFLRVEGPLGLVARPIRLQKSEEIKVYPRLRPIRYPDLATYRRVAYQSGLRRTRLRGEGREFEP